MTNTTLRAYLDELKLLLEQEALEEVMGHCRHILQHFPKNVETYRILGRALLEKNRHQEAGDVFERVLSAVPDDFVSHLGLSAVSEAVGQIPRAIWHLERAHEQEPNNTALRDELKRLYERQDGAAPERLQMTLGGLAYTYYRSKLYEQAVTELKHALDQMPDRGDLLVLLANAYWDTERPVEAAETALQLLGILPNSLQGNRIVAAVWLKAGRPSDAAPFVSRLEQLDPYLAWQTVSPDQALPRDAFMLPRLDWDARAAAALTNDVPDWVQSMGSVFDAPESVSLSGSPLDFSAPGSQPAAPDSASKGQSGLLRSRMTSALNKSSAQADQSDLVPEVPDWFKDVVPDANAPAAGGATDLPDWFNDEPAAPSTPASAAPASWLDDESENDQSNQMPSGFTDLLAGVQQGRASVPASPTPPAALDIPDWLSDAMSAEPAEAGQTPAGASDGPSGEAVDAMSWLVTGPLSSPDQPSAVESNSSTNIQSPATESAALNNDLDWLSQSGDFGEQAQAQPEHSSEEISAPSDFNALDWMTEAANESVQAPQSADAGQIASGSASSPSTEDDSEADAWLATFMGTQSESQFPSQSTPQAEESAATFDDWLSEQPSQNDLSIPTASTGSQQPVELEDDWLASFESPSVQASDASSAESGDWLATSGQDSAMPAAPAGSGADDADEWLQSFESAEAPDNAEAIASSSGGDDWLSSFSTQEDNTGGNEYNPPVRSAGIDATTSLELPDWMHYEADGAAEDQAGQGDLGGFGASQSQVEPSEEPAQAGPGQFTSWLNEMGVAKGTPSAAPHESFDIDDSEESAQPEASAAKSGPEKLGG